MASTGASTKELKRTFGRGDLLGMAIGSVIGAGIMSLTGVAIGLTGRSVPFAFLIAAVFMLVIAGPYAVASGTVRMRGGQYTQVALLLGEKFAGIYLIIFIFTNISIAMYALSFADYFIALIPGIPRTACAIACILVFYLFNLVGVQTAKVVQNIIVIAMCIALGLFAAFGVSKVDPGYFTLDKGFFLGGTIGFFRATALLTQATSGAAAIANFGAESKNAKKDIPFAIIFSTIIVGCLYGFMSVVAAGVLPIETVAGQPLTYVAEAVLSKPLYVFFIVGGGMFALASTLNAQLAWATKPILQGCVDGWFPASLGKLTKKNKVPYILLTIYMVIGIVPILIGFDIEAVANMSLVLGSLVVIMVSLSIIRLPKVLPEEWENATFKLSKPALYALAISATVICILQLSVIAAFFTPAILIGNVVLLIGAIAYAYWRSKTGKVHMEISYETE